MKTNIFDLIGIYWQCQKHFGLSNGASSLYFFLLYKFNDSRWPDSLGISSLEIGGMLGISKPSILKYKDELAETGLIECEFLTGKIRQTYSLRNPKLMFDGVRFEEDSKRDSKQHSKQHSQNSCLTYIEKTKTKTNTPYSPPDRGQKKEREKQAGIIYECYPRKVARPKAIQAIAKHISTIGFDDLLDKTKAYAKAVADKDPQFIPHPSTWFGQERFNDDISTWTQGSGTGSKGSELEATGPQRVMMLQERQKALREEMRTYRNQHRSESALTATWDPGTREIYNQMASKLKDIQSKLDEAI